MDGAQLARWTRFAGKGGIGKCTAIRDCIAESGDDLMFLKDDPIIVLMQLSSPDEGWYLGYCEGVVGRFNGADVQFEKGERLKKPVLAKRGSSRLSSLELVDTPKSPLFSKGSFIEEEKIPEVEDKAEESLAIAPPTTTDAVEDARPLSDGESAAVSPPESTSGSSTVRESTTISVAETAVDRESAGMNIGFALLQGSDDDDDSSLYSSEEDTLPTVQTRKQIVEDPVKDDTVETAAIKPETTTTTVEEEREAAKEEDDDSDEDPSKSPSLSVWDIYDDYRYSRATMHQSLSTSSIHSTNGPTLPSPLLHTRFSNSSASASPTSSTFPSDASPASTAPLLPPPSPLAPSLPPEVTSPPSTPPLMVRKRIHPSASDGPRESLFLPHPNAPRAPSTAPEEPPTSNNLIPTLEHVLTLPRGTTIYGRTLADLSNASGPVGITFTVDPPPLPPPPPIFAPRTSSPLRTRSSVSALRESPSPVPRPFNGPPAPRPRSRSFSDLHAAAVQQIAPSPTRMRTASAAPPVVTTTPPSVTTPSPPSRLRSNSVAPKPTLTRLSFESPPSSPTTTSASHSLSLLTKIPESNSELLPPPSNESPLTASSPASLSAFPMPPRGNSPASLSSFPLPPTLPPPSITPITSPPRKLSLPNLRARTVSHRAATLQAQRPPSFQSRPSVSESIRPSLDTGSIKSQSSTQIQVKSTEFELVAPSPISTSPSTTSPSSPFPPARPAPVERQRSAQEKQQDRDRETKFLTILSTPKSKQKKLRKLVMEGGGIAMSVRWLVWMELVGGESKEQPNTNGAMGGGILTSGPRGKSQAALTALLASETSSASSPAEKLVRAYRRMCPDVAASDELSSILTFLLTLAPEQDAFWIFCCVMDSSLRGYFTADEQALEIDGELFARALGKADGQLAQHLLTTLGIPAGRLIREAGVRKGFVGVIRDSDGDEEELRRVWDVWVCDGLPTVIKTLLTIVTILRAKLMSCKTDSAAKDLLRRGVCVRRGEIERIGRERAWKVPEEEVSFLSRVSHS
ncbi:hypothetical protein IW261DRAFT_1446485 [Armillaria novae-zelandiae]|uniref:SH3 domain-containing protein n=1 Tax=Armillaria novae-zelandiae TaxID=153914 RepID=A0AA39TG98_9AGAR|nr:hypothetical protein IW261DRAFT_1446485 [Armillaria novae-zelandiae]